jgi:hypothetical protein
MGLVIGSRASAGAFSQALLTAESTGQSRWLPARLRACSQARPRVAGERRARSILNDAPACSKPAEVGNRPNGCRNTLGVGRVARRARLVIEPYSRPLPRLTLKAGHKEGLPTNPTTACGAICPCIRAVPFLNEMQPILGIINLSILNCIYIEHFGQSMSGLRLVDILISVGRYQDIYLLGLLMWRTTNFIL